MNDLRSLLTMICIYIGHDAIKKAAILKFTNKWGLLELAADIGTLLYVF